MTKAQRRADGENKHAEGGTRMPRWRGLMERRDDEEANPRLDPSTMVTPEISEVDIGDCTTAQEGASEDHRKLHTYGWARGAGR